MDILLIEPPVATSFGNLRILGSIGTFKADVAWPPLDLLIISGILRKNKIDSTIVDASSTRIPMSDVKKIVEKEKPRIVIFTTATTTIKNDLNVAKAVKEISPNTLTVAIGTHITAVPEETLSECKELDIAIYSEPEMVILDLINAGYNPKAVLGLCYRNNGKIIKNLPHPLPYNLDDFGFPSHDKVPTRIYRDPMLKREPMTITFGSRGCINACTYCSAPFYTKLRLRKVENIIEELKWIVSLGIKEIRFFDCGFTNNLEWANDLVEQMMKNKIDLTWACNVRADRFPHNLALKIKKAGCHSVHIGAESSDINILGNIKKNITPEAVEKAVETAKKLKFNTLVYFMFGLPGETEMTMNKTIQFAKKLNPDWVTFGIATPHPGTEFYRFIETNKLLTTKDWSKYDPMQPPVYEYPNLSGEKIYTTMKKAYRSFYLRPSYIGKRAFKLRNVLDVKINFTNFLAFMQRYVFNHR